MFAAEEKRVAEEAAEEAAIAAETAVAAAAVVATQVPSQTTSAWEAVDDGQGNTYYYNKLTGETSWEAPPAVGAAAGDGTPIDTGEGYADMSQAYAAVEGEEQWPAEEAAVGDGGGTDAGADGFPSVEKPAEGGAVEDAAAVEQGAAADAGDGAADAEAEAEAAPTAEAGGEEEAGTPAPAAPAEGEAPAPAEGEAAAPVVAEASTALVPAAAANPNAAWCAVDDGAGNVYYFNTMTQESTWELPAGATLGEGVTPVGDGATAVAAATEAGGDGGGGGEGSQAQQPKYSMSGVPLGPEWELVDDGQGNIYYYNVETGLSQWETPRPGAADGEAA